MKRQIGIIITVYSLNKNLLKVIKSIQNQSQLPRELIIVTHKKFKIKNSKKLKIKIITCPISNQVYQRTFGLKYLSKSTKILLQLDDRVVLYSNAIFELNNFWNKANKGTIGVGLNPKDNFDDHGLINYFFKKIGFHGKIILGFFNIGYSNFSKNTEVDWLKGGLSSWNLSEVPQIYKRKFPMWKWCVGEDLEFSLSRKKNKKLLVLGKSRAKLLQRDSYPKDILLRRGYYNILSKKRISNLLKKEFFVRIIVYIIFNFFINLISLKKINFSFGQIKALIHIIFKKKNSIINE